MEVLIDKKLRHHYGAALAVVIARLGNLEQAEEAMQEAAIKALQHWPQKMPANPAAWLVKVASHCAIDHWRKESKHHHSDDFQKVLQQSASQFPEINEFEDSTLQLIFMCCHPALAQEQQIALTLKLVMGFENKEIARAFLVSEKTLEQRITRAKRKIIANQIDLSLPSTRHLSLRLPAVQQTLYLIFNEGYQLSFSDHLYSQHQCLQAIRLIRSLCRIFRSQSNSLALLALMLFIQARSPARGTHELITLEQQDRRLWKHSLITQADTLLQKSLRMGQVSSYHIQAAIAGLHSQAKSFEQQVRAVCSGKLFVEKTEFAFPQAVYLKRGHARMHVPMLLKHSISGYLTGTKQSKNVNIVASHSPMNSHIFISILILFLARGLRQKKFG